MEFIYYINWILIDAYFYKFWMSRKEFEKYNIKNSRNVGSTN